MVFLKPRPVVEHVQPRRPVESAPPLEKDPDFGVELYLDRYLAPGVHLREPEPEPEPAECYAPP
jgi:hypothetical protein